VGSYFDNKRSRTVVICKLMDEYKESGDLDIDLPSTCKRRIRKLEHRKRQVACGIISNYIQNEKEGVPKRELKKRTSR
jgi:hypothetical protein